MKKTLIALTAAATLAIGFSATQAKADSFYFGVGGNGQPHFGMSIGNGYGYGGGYGGGYYNTGWGGGYSGCGPHIVKKWVYNPWVHHMVPVWKKVWTCY